MEIIENINYLKSAFKWLRSFLNDENWKERKRNIESYFDLPKAGQNSGGYPLANRRGLFIDDQFAWYLFLVDSYLNNSNYYDPPQGGKVISLFITLGKYLPLKK